MAYNIEGCTVLEEFLDLSYFLEGFFGGGGGWGLLSKFYGINGQIWRE